MRQMVPFRYLRDGRRGAAAVAAAALLACAPAAGAPGPAAARAVSVAAAANVKPAVDDLARAFEAAHPGVTVAVTAGASGAIFAQLRSGAPFDIFFSADREYPRRLAAAGLASGDETVYAVGRLAVWTPPGSRLDLAGRGLAALADPAVRRLAIANPAVAPYGAAAEAALRAAGVWDALGDRLVLGESVAQAAQFARTGAADAAVLPLSLARSPALAAGRTWTVPASAHPPILQAAVVLRSARDPTLAAELLRFATGPAGRAVLARHGYALP
jgi:molybdate transport system substrate-binding protein